MVSFNISDFRSALSLDGARPNLFRVTMNFPANVVDGAGAAANKLTFMCKTAQLPGSTIGSVVVPYFGREVKLAGNRTFPDWTITIINDEDFRVRDAFEEWMDGLNRHEFNTRNGNFRRPNSYVQDARVTQFNKVGGQIKEYQFVGCFPIDVSPIDVDWGANDTIEEFTVTLQYQYWTSDTTS